MIRTVTQPIANIIITETPRGREGYCVGEQGVTLIDTDWKPVPSWWRELLARWSATPFPVVVLIPYVRVWTGDICVGEWPQHELQGIYFAADQAEIDDLIQSDPTRLLAAFRQADGPAQDIA